MRPASPARLWPDRLWPSRLWPDRLSGVTIAGSLLARGMVRPRPRPTTTTERLGMLPCHDLPVAAAVTIYWNDQQIPFIEASSDEDLAVGLGAVHAHLRLAQLEMMRRVAFGRVAELIGPLGIGIDHSVRLLDLARAVPEIIAGLPPATRRWVEGFLRGINHHLAHARELPHEFRLLGFRPEPWTLTEFFTVARLVAADVTWLVWPRLLRAREALGAAAWAKLWPLLLASGAPADLGGENAAADAIAANTRGGSNSAAVAASRRGPAGRGAMIASDPHLGLALPNQWLIAGMKSPGLHAVGLMLPGVPAIALGRNPWVAWGGTSLHAASSELVDVSALPAAAFEERMETIRVRGSRVRQIRLRHTKFGPVVSDAPLLRSERPFAFRWVGHRASDELTALLGIARSRDWEGFRSALEGFAVPGQNMVFASAEGRVGHVIAAHLPRRPPGHPADLVIPPEAAWTLDAVAGGDEMPARVDPAEGFVASANDRPEGAPFPVGYFFAPPDRVRRIRALLGGSEAIAVETLRRLQQDVVQPGILPLRDFLLGALGQAAPPRAAAFRAALAGWDGSYDAHSSGALAFEMLFGHLVRQLWRSPAIAPYQAVWTTRLLLGAALRALPPGELQRALPPAVRRAVAGFRRYRRWGAVHRIRPSHMLARVPLFGRRYALADFAAAGGNDTLNKTAHGLVRGRHTVRFGACARHVSDLADLDANQFVLLGGQDGWIGSANFADQTALWQRGGYITVPMRIETIRRCFRHVTILQPVRAAPAEA